MSTQTLYNPTKASASSVDRPVGDPVTLLAVRVLAAASLLVAAYIHLSLAFESDLTTTPVTMGQMFIGQSVAMVVVAALLLFGDHDRIWLVALLVAVGSAVPLLASVYMPLPAIGPFPPINEPVWYTEKVISLAAEVALPVLWLIRRIAPPQP